MFYSFYLQFIRTYTNSYLHYIAKISLGYTHSKSHISVRLSLNNVFERVGNVDNIETTEILLLQRA